jgi:hypothetical protein
MQRLAMPPKVANRCRVWTGDERMQHKKTASPTAGQAQLEGTKELADVLRSLHRLLLDYGPEWYITETDNRVRKALANADSVLTKPCSKCSSKS